MSGQAGPLTIRRIKPRSRVFRKLLIGPVRRVGKEPGTPRYVPPVRRDVIENGNKRNVLTGKGQAPLSIAGQGTDQDDTLGLDFAQLQVDHSTRSVADSTDATRISRHVKRVNRGKRFKSSKGANSVPLVQINNGTFYEQVDSSDKGSRSNASPRSIASNLSVRLLIPNGSRGHRFAIMAPNPTQILDIIRGKYSTNDPKTRTYPLLANEQDPKMRLVSNAIQYVGFNTATGPGVRGAYLSARFESHREVTDWTLEQYLRGQTELNASADLVQSIDEDLLADLIIRLRLGNLMQMPVSNLSNGQTRRSRIAKALLKKPKLLLLDEPFMGLDPPSTTSLSMMLKDLAHNSKPAILLGLKPHDPVPSWINRLAILNHDNQVMICEYPSKALFSIFVWSLALKDGAQSASSEAPVVHSIERSLVKMKNSVVAEELVQALGPPPFASSSILTRRGIHTFTDVHNPELQDKYDPQTTTDVLPPTLRKGATASIAPYDAETEAIGGKDQSYPSVDLELGSSKRRWLKQHWRNRGVPVRQAKVLVPAVPKRSEAAIATSEPVSLPDATTSHRTSLIELNSIIVKYGEKVVLGHNPPQPGFSQQGLNLTISQGSRILLLGPNGSGKTTLLSLLTSDHPQSYSLPIKFFGRTRLPEPGVPGLSLWEIQSRIGYSSPEVHAFFPKNQSVRQVLESAWAETFSSKPQLTPERSALVDYFLEVWTKELCQTRADAKGWASDKVNHPLFGRLPVATQRLLLFLRAIIKQPDIVVLDEAFSGMPTETRDKAHAWLEYGDRQTSHTPIFPGLTDQQALIVVSHVREEIPDCIKDYIRLPSEEEAMDGKTIMTGSSEHGFIKSVEGWRRLWNI